MNAIKKKRTNEGLTQEQLAKKLGITKSYVCYLENGKKFPGGKVGKRIAQWLGVPMETLYPEDKAA